MESKKIIYYEQIDSTNRQIERLAKDGVGHGTVVVAKRQTAGKGRRGRIWESSADGNIYMSILLRPKMTPDKAPMLTLVMAYSVAKALQKYGVSDVQIKWPNDLILSGKKVCGILTEMHLAGTEIDYVTVGVGVNVNAEVFPEELRDKATSLYLESGKTFPCQPMIADIVAIFEQHYEQFADCTDLEFLQEAYNALLINRDKEVCVLEPGNTYTAYAKGINSLGELLVETADGREKKIFAGEVSVRGVFGYI